MIGVVIWSCETRRQAVIWCDDHAALAYLSRPEDFGAATGWPTPGEMVTLETETLGELRYARNVRPDDEPARATLPSLLRNAAARPTSHLHLVETTPPAAPPARVEGVVTLRRIAAAR